MCGLGPEAGVTLDVCAQFDLVELLIVMTTAASSWFFINSLLYLKQLLLWGLKHEKMYMM